MSDLLAYADEISVIPEQTISFKVSSDNPGEFDFQVVPFVAVMILRRVLD